MSYIIFDLDATDEGTEHAFEAELRKIEIDGLLWGAGGLDPSFKLLRSFQIFCFVKDDKVGDLLKEKVNALLEKKFPDIEIDAFN